MCHVSGYELVSESKMKLACVFSKSIHECGYSVGNCSVCADLMEKGKPLV